MRRPADGREGGREATGEPKSRGELDSEDRQVRQVRQECSEAEEPAGTKFSESELSSTDAHREVEQNASIRWITCIFSPES